MSANDSESLNNANGRWSIAGWRTILARPVRADSLIVVQAIVGIVMMLEALWLLRPTASGTNLDVIYADPPFHFTYHAFGWVSAAPSGILRALVIGQLVSGLFLAMNRFVRPAAVFIAVVWGYLLLVDVTRFNNHYYLEILLCVIIASAPRPRSTSPAVGWIRSGWIPFWPIMLLRVQLLVVYFWGGVVKLSEEWLDHSEPMRTLLADPRVLGELRSMFPPSIAEPLGHQLNTPLTASMLSYAGLLFDFAIGPMLLFRRTRIVGILLAAGFHGINHLILFDDIGYFPVLALALTTVFFDPDWPRNWFVRRHVADPSPTLSVRWPALLFVSVWIGVQAMAPCVAYLAFTGPLIWTGSADQFCWRMKAGAKHAGLIDLQVKDPQLLDAAGNVDWVNWPGERIIYRRWSPEVPCPNEPFVEFQPIAGERILVVTDAIQPNNRERILKDWQERHHRPATVVATEPMSRILDALEQSLRQASDSANTLAILRTCQELAAEWERLSGSPDRRPLIWDDLRRNLVALANHPDAGTRARVKLALRYVHPFTLQLGPDASLPAYTIEDPRVMQPDGRRYHGTYSAVDRILFTRSPTEPLHVFGCFTGMTGPEFVRFPRYRWGEDDQWRPVCVVNPYEELREFQWIMAATQPFLCRQYARHLADEYQRAFGRRPAIHMSVDVAVAPYQPQPLIDPRADLARSTWNPWESMPWIAPFQRVVDPRRSERLP